MCTLRATTARRRSRNSILRQLQLGRLPQGQRNASRQLRLVSRVCRSTNSLHCPDFLSTPAASAAATAMVAKQETKSATTSPHIHIAAGFCVRLLPELGQGRCNDACVGGAASRQQRIRGPVSREPSDN
jgi:hypothetical protein